MITTVKGNNQITIPAKLARKLNIEPGTRLDWSIDEEGRLIARPLPRRGVLARQTAGMGQKWVTEDADPVADLICERADEDRNEGLL
jgi:AbrB family looped-hinge helix DNA binding protein